MNSNLCSFFKFTHRWLGLIGGWFLFFIIVSGTISVFDQEINQWMQPELALHHPGHEITPQALNNAYDLWLENKNIKKNLIALPSERNPFITVLHAEGNMLRGITIDPIQGNIIPTRQAAGGFFINSVHHNLFIGRYWGGMLVMIISILLFISLVTGIIIHYSNFFKSLFLIQPYINLLKFKLDFHTVAGIFFLPFFFIMSISGFLFLIPRYLPDTTPHSQHKGIQRNHSSDSLRPNLFPLLQTASKQFNELPSSITFAKNNIIFTQRDSHQLAMVKNSITFDKSSGNITSIPKQHDYLTFTKRILLGIHKARSGGMFFRSIFFLMGIGSAILVACGLFYYSNRKLKMVNKNTPTFQIIGYKIINGLNIGTTIGTSTAFISLFWVNRLLPRHIEYRVEQEISYFFLIFFVSLLIGLISPLFNINKVFWQSSLLLLSGLCFLLPFLDYITTSSSFYQALTHNNYLYITIDFIIGLCGILFIQLYRYSKNQKA